jgi:hypothetical protein
MPSEKANEEVHEGNEMKDIKKKEDIDESLLDKHS